MADLPQHDIYMQDTLEGRRQLEAIFNYFHKGDARQSMIDSVKRLIDEQSK